MWIVKVKNLDADYIISKNKRKTIKDLFVKEEEDSEKKNWGDKKWRKNIEDGSWN